MELGDKVKLLSGGALGSDKALSAKSTGKLFRTTLENWKFRRGQFIIETVDSAVRMDVLAADALRILLAESHVMLK